MHRLLSKDILHSLRPFINIFHSCRKRKREEKKKVSPVACLQSSHVLRYHTPAEACRWNIYIYIGQKFKVKTIRECLNMREMLETSHLSALMAASSHHQQRRPVNLWMRSTCGTPLMQFRVSPKAWVITCRQTAGPSSAQRAALAPHLYGGRLSQLSVTKDVITHSAVFLPFTIWLTAGAVPRQLSEVLKFYLWQTHGFHVVETAAAATAAAAAPQSDCVLVSLCP